MIVFLYLVIIIVILTIVSILSSIEIEIKDFTIENIEKVEEIIKVLINEKSEEKRLNLLNTLFFEVKLRVLILKKIPILFFYVDNIKLKRLLLKRYEKDIKKHKDIKKKQGKIKKLMMKVAKEGTLKESDFNMQFGLENASATAILSTWICIILSMLISKSYEQTKIKNINYKVEPIYLNKDVFFLQFSFIISINIIHITRVICEKEEKQ